MGHTSKGGGSNCTKFTSVRRRAKHVHFRLLGMDLRERPVSDERGHDAADLAKRRLLFEVCDSTHELRLLQGLLVLLNDAPPGHGASGQTMS